MLISYPFLPVRGAAMSDSDYEESILDLEMLNAGVYPSSHEREWHGGIHIQAPDTTEAVRAIADGTLIAYRLNNELTRERYDDAKGRIDNSFVLIRHEMETDSVLDDNGIETPVKVVFYSLYMHLMNTADMVTKGVNRQAIHASIAESGPSVQSGNNTKIYRKDIIGFPGESYSNAGMIHFEIFATDQALSAFFVDSQNSSEIGKKGTWGDSYFIVKAGSPVVAAHPHGNTMIGEHICPVGAAGEVHASKDLFVRIAFRNGTKYTTAWLEGEVDKPPTLLTSDEGVADEGYEYCMYAIATELYRSCPSAGMELLRLGKCLSSDRDRLAANEKHNWQFITYAVGQQGYLDLADPAVVKQVLSDADFPYWLGWQKGIGGLFADSGQCDIHDLLTVLKVPHEGERSEIARQQLRDYLRDSEHRHLRDWTRGLIVQYPSEWDKANNTRCTKLKEKDGLGPGRDGPYVDNDEEYGKHMAFVESLQWWGDTSIGSSNVWHFHPFAFIRHLRKCGWLSQSELAQCIPRTNKHLAHTVFAQQVVANWQTAFSRAKTWVLPFNRMARKYGVSSTKPRILHFLAQSIEESGYLRLVKEGDGEHKSYSPYYGRGLIQLTFSSTYKKYGSFRKFPTTETGNSRYHEVGWNPDALLALDNLYFNADNCADSAGFYWTCPTVTAIHRNGLELSDRGVELDDVFGVSKLVNGNVAPENVNGLDIRMQLAVWLRYVLLLTVTAA